MMMSCAIPRKIYMTKKPLSPLLPESPAIVKPQAVVMSKEKIARKVAKFHKKMKYNLATCKQKLEVKKLKDALEARRGKSVEFPIEISKKAKLKKSAEKQAERKSKNFPEPKKVSKVMNNLKMNPSYYWSARDARNGLILPSHLFVKLKQEFALKVKV
jgi:hypothetical protein